MYISDKAEFTPRNVQTVEGRKTTVFAIKLMLADAGGKLKPGMPADVLFKSSIEEGMSNTHFMGLNP
jgi:HlyD family secretion protein